MGSDDNKMVKVTRLTISSALAENCGLSGVKSAKVTDTIINEIVKSIIRDKKLKITGFGSFFVTKRAPRKGRNLKTGGSVFIPAQNHVSFKPSLTLKSRIQKAYIK